MIRHCPVAIPWASEAGLSMPPPPMSGAFRTVPLTWDHVPAGVLLLPYPQAFPVPR